MDYLDNLKQTLEELRPLNTEQMSALWPRYEAERPIFVQSTNAIEGNTLTLGETTVVLQEGVTIGGKSVKEHVEAINGGRAFDLMLAMASDQRAITKNTLLALHEVIVAGESYAGQFRNQAVYISGAEHVPPNHEKVRGLMDDVFATYEKDLKKGHPVVAGAKLHFNIVMVHPFVDGNGRTARLINNLHLIKCGYPPVIIDASQDKPEYFETLNRASISGEPGKGDPTEFVAYMVRLEARALKRYFKVLTLAHGDALGENEPSSR